MQCLRRLNAGNQRSGAEPGEKHACNPERHRPDANPPDRIAQRNDGKQHEDRVFSAEFCQLIHGIFLMMVGSVASQFHEKPRLKVDQFCKRG